MLQNYFRVAIRNLLKNKLYSIINLSGLTVGMTCFILIALYIQHELNYDVHFEKANRIYRIAQVQEGNVFRGTNRFALAPAPLTDALKEEFPEVEAATTMRVNEMLLAHEKKVFYERGLFADEHLFEVFEFPVVAGAGGEALKDPNAILLTESLAKKYFAGEDPLGQTLLLQNEHPLTVRGIIEDVPGNQHFTFDYLVPIVQAPYYDPAAWNNNAYYAYAVLPEGYDSRTLEKKLVLLDRKYISEEGDKPVPHSKFFLQPLKDIHLHSQLNFEIEANGDIRYIYLFASIAFIILLLAAINYTNIATAGSAGRTREVGIRKVLGARKRQLLQQFLGESFLLTLISFALALILVEALLSPFNLYVDKEISFRLSENGWVLGGMLLSALMIGGLSGLYPAVFLAALSPVKTIQGSVLKNYKKGASLRNVLVVGQFTAALVLAVGSIVIYQQLKYIQNKRLGYNRDQVVFIPYREPVISENAMTIREELLKHSRINKVSFAANIPLDIMNSHTVDEWEGNNTEETFYFYRSEVDHHFINLFEMELLEGRAFSPDMAADTINRYILNASAVKILGWETAVGKRFYNGRVIGVVRDFHFQPIHRKIEPLYMALTEASGIRWGNIAIKVAGNELDKTLAYIQQTFKNIAPQVPFEYQFMDEAYNRLYRSEKRFGQAFGIFTALALFIACIGLFGLASLNVVRRTKEIGIRKVLGATVTHIAGLLSKDFLKLVLIAFLLATPIAWYLMRQWLENFAYRIDIRGWVFVAAGGSALLIAFITTSYQSVRAALTNPVDSLRNE